MRISSKILSLCLLSLILSCKSETDHYVFEISGYDAVSVPFEEIATDIQIVPLSSDEPIDAAQARVYGDELFITDERMEQMWYFRQHKFVSRLSAKGRGPGEYDVLYRWAYHPETHSLYVAPTNKQCILKYDVPSMRFVGSIPTDWFFSGTFNVLNDSSLIMFRTVDEVSRDMARINMPTGRAESILPISAEESEVRMSVTDLLQCKVAVGITGNVNRLGRMEADGTFNEVFRFRFSDGIPETMSRKRTSDNMADKLEYKLFVMGEHYSANVLFPIVGDDGFSFWYTNYNPEDGSDTKIQLYCKSDSVVTHVTDLSIPGLNFCIEADGVTGDGGYFAIINGPSDMRADPDNAPDDLARQIMSALDAQNDYNPILLYYRIR